MPRARLWLTLIALFNGYSRARFGGRLCHVHRRRQGRRDWVPAGRRSRHRPQHLRWAPLRRTARRVQGGRAARPQPLHGGRELPHLPGWPVYAHELLQWDESDRGLRGRFRDANRPGGGCGKQLFRIQTSLAGLTGTVTRTPVSGGTASFNGWLVHLPALSLTATGATCRTFFATVTGLPPDGSVFPRGGAFFTFG
jgi:hypothetical protein